MTERRVTPEPRLSVVLPLPAPSNVAVSPGPGTGETVQLVVVDQSESVVPVQDALSALATAGAKIRAAIAVAARSAAEARQDGIRPDRRADATGAERYSSPCQRWHPFAGPLADTKAKKS